jgi:N-acetylglucosamine transport system substrate-binding protein
MSEIFARPEVDRRTLLRRAAAVGLMATPAAGLLSACVGGGDEPTQKQAEGTKSDTNPLGVDAKAPSR